MNALLSSNVSDPSDFPPEALAPGLRSLDGSLRCTICGELFDAPVTLPCGHCFCSFCVRTAMANKQECPGCRKGANEGHLRPNPVMEEVVAAWKLARPYFLKLSKVDEQQHSIPVNTPKPKKRKIVVSPGNKDCIRSEYFSNICPASPSKCKRARHDSEDLYDTTIPTSDADEDEIHTHGRTAFDPGFDGLISCPVCNKRVKYKSINQHIDNGCQEPSESTRSTKSEWKTIMNGSNKGKQKDTSDSEDNFPLPKASYATLKDKKLKEMLLEHKLPITGDRHFLVQRHQRWVMIYNANLDRSHNNRKSKQELRRELKKWEDERSKKKKTVVEDGLAYEKRHKDEFAQLIDVARRNKPSTSTPRRPFLSERSSDNIITSTSSNSPQSTPQSIKRDSTCEEDMIIIDSEEEREQKS